jgi:hypothetical protein
VLLQASEGSAPRAQVSKQSYAQGQLQQQCLPLGSR